ncbi:hypothetical protein V6N13_050540 [Hibiscus sabdariffa]
MEDGLSSFWGPVTSTDWCEKNYARSSYIAEYFNTISNVPCILLALIGLVNALRQRFEKRFSVLHISNMILAIGSIIYHATLQHMQQQGDETPMVWEMLLYFYILYSPDWHYRSTMPTFLFFYGVVYAVVHAVFRFGFGFKVHYVVLCLICVPRAYKYYIYTKDVSAKRLAKLYVTTLFLASLCWLSDRVFCKEISNCNENGIQKSSTSWGFSLMSRYKKQRASESFGALQVAEGKKEVMCGENVSSRVDSLTEVERSILQEFPTLQMSQSQQKRHKDRAVKEVADNKKGFGGSKNKFAVLTSVVDDVQDLNEGRKVRAASLGVANLLQEMKMKKKDHIGKVKRSNEEGAGSAGGNSLNSLS